MFFNNKESQEKELKLLKTFLNCLDDIDDYLDEYDEIIGLAFEKDEPIECAEKLTHFLRERYYFVSKLKHND